MSEKIRAQPVWLFVILLLTEPGKLLGGVDVAHPVRVFKGYPGGLYGIQQGGHPILPGFQQPIYHGQAGAAVQAQQRLRTAIVGEHAGVFAVAALFDSSSTAWEDSSGISTALTHKSS